MRLAIRRVLWGAALLLLTALPAADAQPTAKHARLGVLLFSTPDGDPNVATFRQALGELGYVEGKNLTTVYRYAESKPERLAGLAVELAALKPDVIFALGGDVAPFARTATSTIPIVMAVSVDPVLAGLVPSLARPGGNVTGVTFASSDLAAKRLQFLKETAPRISRVAVLWNPDHVDPEYAADPGGRSNARRSGSISRSQDSRRSGRSVPGGAKRDAQRRSSWCPPGRRRSAVHESWNGPPADGSLSWRAGVRGRRRGPF